MRHRFWQWPWWALVPVSQILCTSVGHRTIQVLLAAGQILLESISMHCSLTERDERFMSSLLAGQASGWRQAQAQAIGCSCRLALLLLSMCSSALLPAEHKNAPSS